MVLSIIVVAVVVVVLGVAIYYAIHHVSKPPFKVEAKQVHPLSIYTTFPLNCHQRDYFFFEIFFFLIKKKSPYVCMYISASQIQERKFICSRLYNPELMWLIKASAFIAQWWSLFHVNALYVLYLSIF